MRLTRAVLVVAGVFAFVAAVSAQLPTSKQSNSPTSNEYRMQVTEPIEGATIRSNVQRGRRGRPSQFARDLGRSQGAGRRAQTDIPSVGRWKGYGQHSAG